MRSSRAELFKNISLSIVSTIVLLFLLEMVLRVTQVVPVRSLEYATATMWSINPGPLRPGQSYTDRFKRSLPYKVTVNNLGFRGTRDLPLHKRDLTFRVLCLGDSYTFGAYVDDAETWPSQLESILHQEHPDQDMDVINAGISGFTIVDELDFVKEQGLRLEPDLVIVAFVLNDLADLTRRVSSREMLRRSSMETTRSPMSLFRRELRQTAIYNALFLMKAWVLKSAAADPTVQEVDIRHLLQPVYDARTLELFEEYKGHLAELKTLLDRRGIPMVLVIFPYWEQVSRGATDQAQQRLTVIARELEIPVIDLLPSYRHFDPHGRKFFHMPWDHHPSARGYRRAARELATTIGPMVTHGAAPPAPRP